MNKPSVTEADEESALEYIERRLQVVEAGLDGGPYMRTAAKVARVALGLVVQSASFVSSLPP